MVLNTTFNIISAISWRSVFLVKETRVPGETHRPVASHWLTLLGLGLMLYRVHLAWAGFELTMLLVIGIDCIGSCKSNYHSITTMTAPKYAGMYLCQGTLISKPRNSTCLSYWILFLFIKIINKLEACDLINRFNSATFLCLS